jgi:hypothetical protein
MAIAANIIVIWPSTNASIPVGWARETSLDAKYPKGTAAATDPGGTGGALTHTHASTAHTHTSTHTHTVPNSPAGSGNTARDANTTNPPEAHTHVSNPSTINSVTSISNDTPSTDAINHEPPFYTVIFIKSDGSPAGIPVSSVVIWHDANRLPTGFNLADGGGGRPDLRAVFLKGAAAAGDSGGTGGGTTHTAHTLASHTHSTPYTHAHPNVTSSATATALTAGDISGATVATATAAHTHALTIGSQTPAITGSTDAVGSGANEPPYVQHAFIVNGGLEVLPRGVIAIWIGTLATIPVNWILCDGTSGTPDLRSSFVKGATVLTDIGTAAGSLTHTHTATGHTHAVAAHTHTVTAASGLGEIRTAGAVNAATTAHTHASWSDTGSSSFTSGSTTPTVSNQVDTQPPYYAVAYVKYSPSSVPNNYKHLTVGDGMSTSEKIR